LNAAGFLLVGDGYDVLHPHYACVVPHRLGFARSASAHLPAYGRYVDTEKPVGGAGHGLSTAFQHHWDALLRVAATPRRLWHRGDGGPRRRLGRLRATPASRAADRSGAYSRVV